MIVLRILALVLVIAGVGAFADDLRVAGGWDRLDLTTAGDLWVRLYPGSLQAAQAVIERQVWPPLWDPGIVTVLGWPAPLVLAVPGLVLLALAMLIGNRR